MKKGLIALGVLALIAAHLVVLRHFTRASLPLVALLAIGAIVVVAHLRKR